MIITFTVSIEVEDKITLSETMKQAADFETILSDMEEVVAKKGYSLNDSEWEAEEG